MAKKAKKTKYSKGWETRRKNAAKLGVSPHQFKAKRGSHLKPPLRNDLIEIEMRRAARKPVVADALAPTAEAQAINAVRDDWEHVSGISARRAESPGHGEIVGGVDAKLADELIALGRKKGGKDQVQDRIAMIRAQASYEGRSETDKANTKRMVEVQQKMADNIVCGFIAEVDAAQRIHGSLPTNLMWNISSFTVLRIVDALNAAGYTAQGRKS